MGKPHKNLTFVLFLLGLFSMTQIRIIGAIGIAEIPIYILAPYLFLVDYQSLKNDGFLPIIWLALLTCVCACISSCINHTYIAEAIKGFATPYSIFAVMVVLHRLLRKDLSGYKWILLGAAFSQILNIFIFQQSAEMSAFSEGATGFEAGRRIAETSTIFWTSRIRPFIDAFVGGWYTQMPLPISILLIACFAIFSAVSTTSGRSMAAVTIIGLGLLFIGGKSRRRMLFFKRQFYFFVILSILGIVVLSEGYRLSALNGLLGEKAKMKYESQMQERKGVIGILKGGRGEVFIGLTACLDKPFFGHGPWPIDDNDYIKRYVEKYGTPTEWEGFFNHERYLASIGYRRYHMIPAHSHLIAFWLYYGIIGLVFWIYVLYLIVIYFKRYVDVVPQWFGYLAVSVSAFAWNVFFSPYGGRIVTPLMICLILFTRAIAKGRISLPVAMQIEASKYDGRL